MNPTIAVYFVLVMLVAKLMLDAKVRNPAYSCPSCGTKRRDGHAEDCAWKKHYGEEF